jgi:hypothetical protein
MSIANRGNRWQSVNDIAERARFDNQDLQRHDWNTLILALSPREKEPFSRPARVATERLYNDAKVKRTIGRRLK